MTWHPLDGNMRAADAYYDRDEPMPPEPVCDQCGDDGDIRENDKPDADLLHVCRDCYERRYPDGNFFDLVRAS